MFRPVGSVLLVALSACAVTPTPEVPRLGELPEPAWIFDGERRAESACVIGSDVVIADSADVVRLDGATGAPRWTADTGLIVHGLAVANGVVVACGVSKDAESRDTHTMALRGDDGSAQWLTDARVVREPVFVDGDIVVAAQRSDDSTTLEWRSTRDGTLLRDQVVRGALRSDLFRCGPVIAFATSHRLLIAVDAKTGEQRWTHPIGGETWVAFAASGDALFVSESGRSAEDCRIWRVDARTGVESWTQERAWFDDAQVVGDVLYGIGSSGVSARSIEHGMPSWSTGTPSGFDAGLVVHDGIVFAAARRQWVEPPGSSELHHAATLSVFDAADGALLRQSVVDGVENLSPPTLVGTKLVVGIGFPNARIVAYDVAALH